MTRRRARRIRIARNLVIRQWGFHRDEMKPFGWLHMARIVRWERSHGRQRLPPRFAKADAEHRAVETTGAGYTELDPLFRDLHKSVMWLGKGDVRYMDDPRRREIGFLLSTQNETVWQEWRFMISLDDVKTELVKASSKVQEFFTTPTARAKLAKLFEQGLSIEQIIAS